MSFQLPADAAPHAASAQEFRRLAQAAIAAVEDLAAHLPPPGGRGSARYAAARDAVTDALVRLLAQAQRLDDAAAALAEAARTAGVD